MTIAFDANVRPSFVRADYASSANASTVYASTAVRPQGAKHVTVLTPRGRFVLGLVLSAVIGLGGVLLGSTVAATQDVANLPVQSVVVEPGDSLWAIASAANPGGDIRKTVDEIVRLNALEAGRSLPAGLTLSVPVYE